jgi:hypothetical protein
MKFIQLGFLVLCASATYAQGVPAESSERAFFDKKIYTAISLAHLGTSPEQFASLEANQKRDLLECREVFARFFRSVVTHGNLAQYLTPDQAKKYRTAADLVAPETALMEVGILDWNISDDGKGIQLHFFAVVFSEGDWIASMNSMTLKASGAGWRIAKLDWNTKQAD